LRQNAEEKIFDRWKERNDSENFVNFSTNDMKILNVKPGDVIYVCIARKY